jgi:hypothetical protein
MISAEEKGGKSSPGGRESQAACEFKAAGTFHLRSRRIVVIYGDILSGDVRSGMYLALPMNPGFAFTGRIASVEFVDVVPQQRAYVGLVMDYDPQELGFWETMNISDEVLEVSESETKR